MYCGDEIRAVVVDFGSFSTKLGESGEGSPRRVFSSVLGIESVAHTSRSSEPASAAAAAATAASSTTNVSSGASASTGTGIPISSSSSSSSASVSSSAAAASQAQQQQHSSRKIHAGNNALVNWKRGLSVASFVDEDGFVSDWEGMEALWDHAINSKVLIDSPADNPLLLVEPVLNPARCQRKQAELLFEKFNVPALMMANQACAPSLLFHILTHSLTHRVSRP